jgi:FHA domain-containing protein/double zinc ribbon protein
MTIRCSQGHENPDGSAFCDECGEPLAAASPAAAGVAAASGGGVTCATCGAVNAAGEAFCTNCGASLTGAPAGVGAPSGVAPAPAAGAGHPRLVVQSDNASFDLSGKNEVIIGREDAVSNVYPDVDLTPHGGEDDGVSRVHAKLLINGGQYLIEDQNSTNYTFVNRQKLQPKVPTPIKDGDEIRLGRAILKFFA